ncbi:MAG: hypothetical protein IKR29_02790 [Bacteroidales bacterium]|nr:hypothetical protein [Bacteroidales bacterium]
MRTYPHLVQEWQLRGALRCPKRSVRHPAINSTATIVNNTNMIYLLFLIVISS